MVGDAPFGGFAEVVPQGYWWAVGEVPAEQVLFPRPPARTTHASFPRTSLSSDYSVSAGTGFLPWMSA